MHPTSLCHIGWLHWLCYFFFIPQFITTDTVVTADDYSGYRARFSATSLPIDGSNLSQLLLNNSRSDSSVTGYSRRSRPAGLHTDTICSRSCEELLVSCTLTLKLPVTKPDFLGTSPFCHCKYSTTDPMSLIPLVTFTGICREEDGLSLEFLGFLPTSPFRESSYPVQSGLWVFVYAVYVPGGRQRTCTAPGWEEEESQTLRCPPPLATEPFQWDHSRSQHLNLFFISFNF